MTPTWPDATELCTPLVRWFRSEARELPWRAKNLDKPHPNPYAVLVSELMLQQTQVATVIPYFERWMIHFPDAMSLAQADEKIIHKRWEGLGYYRRARYLKAAAEFIVEKGWPSDLQGLRTLPGLGDYTAAAVAAIAFQLPEAALDGNAFRVLSRLLALESDPKTYAPDLRAWLKPALEAHGPSRLTQSLMELGSQVCTRRPRCEVCPLMTSCRAKAMDTVDQIPAPRRLPTPVEVGIFLVAIQAEGYWLLERPSSKGLLAGLWRWQTFPVPDALADQAAEEHATYLASEVTTWPGWVQIYSHRKEQVTPLRIDVVKRSTITADQAWIPNGELEDLPMGRRDQKLRHLLRSPGERYRGFVPLPSLFGGS